MLRRGTKRKNPTDMDEPDEYTKNLTNFQIAARNRESLRLKNQNSIHNACSVGNAVEKHIKDRLAVEMSLVEGTAKFILACKNQKQTLEAAKTLLVARIRSDMLKFELNKIRRGRGSPQNKAGKPSYAELSLSNIRIPLVWRRKEHINDSGEQRRFAVFCLARIGSQIYDTGMVEVVDGYSTDITLSDVILFNRVPPYFEMNIEVYGHCLEKDVSLAKLAASTPQKIVRSISKAVGRKYFEKHLKDFENIGPKFELMGSATLTLDNCSDEIQTNELYIEDPENEALLPLFGQLCCRIAGIPYCCQEEVISGSIDVKLAAKSNRLYEKKAKRVCTNDENAAKNILTQEFKEMWAVLMDWNLSFWTDKSNKDAGRQPNFKIAINRNTKIEDEGDLLTIANQGCDPIEIRFDNKDEVHTWLLHLIQHAADHRRWKKVATEKMEVYIQNKIDTSNCYRTLRRTRSKLVMLYDQE